MSEIEVINISVVGEETKAQYRGAFKVRTLLTLRQQAQADVVRRAILGPDSENAFNILKENAFIAGRLAVAIVDAPDWFRPFGEGGIDCPDRSLIIELHDKWVEAQQERRKKLEASADSAREELSKTKE